MAEYTLFRHRHNFAVWAAARASQRAFTTVKNLREALEGCGVVQALKEPSRWPSSAADFDALHRIWCRSICQHLCGIRVQNVTYGRAAKLVAVYLKAMIVAGGYDDTHLSLIHI